MILTSTNKLDIRTIPLSLETRSTDGGTEISGYALKFGVPSLDMGFTEFINSTALNNVDLSQTMLLYNHDFANILARADAGNLQLKVDGTGLFFSATLPATTLANDVIADIQAGNLKGCSFGFTLPDDGSGDTWTQDASGNLVHTINQFATVSEVSITAIPAYTQTSVQVQRSMENYIKGVEERKMAEENENKSLLDAIKGLQEQVRALTKAEDKADSKDTKDKEADDEKADSKAKDNKDTSANSDSKDEDKEESRAESKELDTAIDKESEKNTKRETTVSETKAEVKEEVETRNLENKGEIKIDMAKDITPEISKKDEEVRNFEKYIRTGKRDTTGGFSEGTDGGAVIPVDVLNVLEQPNDPSLLSGYVNKVQVSSPVGKLPVLARATAVMASATELADNPAIANATITPVSYDVATLRGALPVSLEMVQDYPDITGLLQNYVGTIKDRTEQRKIGAVLQQATAVAATSIDDLKGIFNGNDLVWYTNKVVVVTASGYDWLDTQKDANGRYLLQDSIASATGKQLFGAQVIEVADDVLGAVGDKKMFIGDIKSFVLEAIKANLAVNWVRNEQFEQVLQVVLRADFKVADSDAGKFITISEASK